MHIHRIEDNHGDVVGVMYFCSDACHRQWCARTDTPYDGWDGCHEGGELGEWCNNCGVICNVPTDAECDCGYATRVNRFRVTEPEHCEHGMLIQMALEMPHGNDPDKDTASA